MKRLNISPRPNWQSLCENVGFTFHTERGIPYWDEEHCYQLTLAEVEILERATAHLQELYIEATEYVFRNNLNERLSIDPKFFELAQYSWDNNEPSIYGRFDLCYDGLHPPKLIEFNADTPTSLIEAAIAQWFWLQEVFPEHDQFNSIHEKLLACFKHLKQVASPPINTMHFTCIEDMEEDWKTVEYLRDLAIQAGWQTKQLFMGEIGYYEDKAIFVDLDNQPIDYLFKLYPWEWLVQDPFAAHLLNRPMRIEEPAWKMVWSNKGMLPILWELFPDAPNLLAASAIETTFPNGTVRKPLLSREGANVSITAPGINLSTHGTYGAEGFIWQEFCPLPSFDGARPMIGSWIIGGEPAGLGIRESTTLVTDNLSRFVPHYFY
jgi:glutathionylspermidine synthase